MKLMKKKTTKLILSASILIIFLLIVTVLSIGHSNTHQATNYNIAANATTPIKKPDFANIKDVKRKKTSVY